MSRNANLRPESQRKYDLAVIIGRFQPVHKGHFQLFRKAAEVANRTLILIGSANSPRTPKNPLTWQERADMLLAAHDMENLHHPFKVEPLEDHWYNYDRWIEEVRTITAKYSNDQVALVGFHKDFSSEYLNYFKPNFDLIQADPLLYEGISTPMSATELREEELGGMPKNLTSFPHFMLSVRSQIQSERDKVMSQLIAEREHIQSYKRLWQDSPFPPTFMCADSFVMQSGHILMVKRGGHPGKGLWALPGGYIDQKETGLEAAIRELHEETGLKVVPRVLKGSLFAERTFDAPERSLRGRTFTMAFGFKLDDSMDLPKVKGGDDAEKAEWIPIEVIRASRNRIFEDHYDMIEWFLGRI